MRRELQRWLRAWLLLATFVCALGSSQLSANHFGIIDTACGDVALAAPEGPRVGVVLGGSAEHCPVCHFLRAVSGATTSTVAQVGVPECMALLTAAASLVPTRTEALTRLSRGPPSAIPPAVGFF